MSFAKILRDTAANLAHDNPLLDADQIGFESDTGKGKRGDGLTRYNLLSYSIFPSIPYDLACQVTGKPAASAVILRHIAVRAFALAAAGHRGTAGTGANAQADFLVAVNGVTKATLRFAASGTTISIVGGTAANIAAGDVVTITAPSGQDAALSDLAFTLSGVLV